MMDPIRFGTDGWRAVIGADYTYFNVRRVIQAFCDFTRRSSSKSPIQVILGYDRRFSSQLFAREAASVLAANGIFVKMANRFTPTPAVSWMTADTQSAAGIVITASHNPFQWNGIKFKEPDGGSASPAYTQKIEKEILENDQKGSSPLWIDFEQGRSKGLITDFDPHFEYIAQLGRMVDLERIRKANLRIIFDAIHGAGAGYLKAVLGQEIIELRSEENPSFGGANPEPIAKNIRGLLETARSKSCDIGLATDGDADRIGAVDENGNFVDSHKIFALILRHLIERRGLKGGVVTTVSTTQMIQRLADHFSLPVFETPIGFKYICEQFRNMDPLIGGEESGGIAIASHVPERDGLLSALFLLEILATEKKPFSKILADLQQNFGPLYFVRDDLEISKEKIELLKERLKSNPPTEWNAHAVLHQNLKDGFKYLLNDGSWLLIRPSGTEPLLRLYAEASTIENAEALIDAAKAML